MDFLLKQGQACRIRISRDETEAVKMAAANLAADLYQVLECRAAAGGEKDREEDPRQAEEVCPQIYVGTIGVGEGPISASDDRKLRDERGKLRKEAYRIRVQDGQLIIAGADRRGTVYGIYEFCQWMGVSPWYFWADVPVKKKREIRLPEGYEKWDYPSVEYRGIFINDEEELEAWVQKRMGEDTIGVKTYEKVFELLLRLKGNYIWPAMHVNSFNMTPENGALADRMGIVVGTSHCDMLMRSNNREWKPWIAKKGYRDAVYDYSVPGRNREILQEYWRESVEQNRDFEVCYTLGMRGIHDSGFETKELAGKSEEEIRGAKVRLLETIISDQRRILRKTLGKDTMMTFIPYKEVLELYDSGLEIPEDMTLVWANDNYGYIRRYPSEKEKLRSGGNGIYYHNSYWAPPGMSYVFLCSIPLAHTKNELEKAWQEGIRKLWVLNSGAMKPLEQEIEFFLRLAWEAGKKDRLTEDVDRYAADWIDRNFSGGIGKQTAALLNDFSQLTNVRKLENMDSDAFSQTAYGDEAVIRIHKYEALFEKGNAIYKGLPKEEKDAFFQLVLMRIHAGYFTNLAYYCGDRSTLCYEQGKMQAAALYTEYSRMADEARRKLLVYYNKVMAGGKWDGILNPEGFPPPRAAFIPVCTPPLSVGKQKMLLHLWNDEEEICFVKPGTKWLEIGNGGEGSFSFCLEAPAWLCLSKTEGWVRTEERILVTAADVSTDRQGEILVKNQSDGTQKKITVRITALKTKDAIPEDGGMVCLEADSALEFRTPEAGLSKKTAEETGFRIIKRLGRHEGNLAEACAVRKAPREAVSKGLTYPVSFTEEGKFLLEIHRFPSLNSTGRIRIGVSVDGGNVSVVESLSTDEWRGNWKTNVLNNVDRLYWKMPPLQAGRHEITLHAIDPYFAFSRLLVYTKQRKENNLAGVTGEQGLPLQRDLAGWTEHFYGPVALSLRPVLYTAREYDRDTVKPTGILKYPVGTGKRVEPDWYFERAAYIFTEKRNAIPVDLAAALGQTEFANMYGGNWRHCAGEAFGRSGLDLYLRQPGQQWEYSPNAPSLNYRILCTGGEYMLWMLAKFSVKEESFYGIGIDGELLPAEKLYGVGSLWRYESEQIYQWVPAAIVRLTPGQHTLSVYSLYPGMRFERIYLTKGEELPPEDGAWETD